nr:MAG TPA: hypothetical protein [Caudoviricetes sp.]
MELFLVAKKVSSSHLNDGSSRSQVLYNNGRYRVSSSHLSHGSEESQVLYNKW